MFKKEKAKLGRKKKSVRDKTVGIYVGLSGQEVEDLLSINDDLLDSSFNTVNKRGTRIIKKYILNWKGEKNERN